MRPALLVALGVAVALAASGTVALTAQDRIRSFSSFGDEAYRAPHPEAMAVDAEIDAFMARTMPLLTKASPDAESAPILGLRVRYAIDPVTGAGLQEFDFPRVPSGSSHVLFVDAARGTYRLFTMDPADLPGDARRIVQYTASKGIAENEALVQASLLDLHAGRLSLEARMKIEVMNAQRRDYCTMLGHLEVRTWEPAFQPVAITDLSTRFNGYPTYFHLARWGGCWANPEINLRAIVTHWFLNRCVPGVRRSGSWTTAEMRGRYYNDDFVLNVGRVWVNHIVRIAHDDYNGNIRVQGWASTSGGGFAANRLLAHGINPVTRQETSNCNL